MCGLYASLLMYHIRPRIKCHWRLVKNFSRFLSTESRTVLSLAQAEDLKPSYVFEEGFICNISTTLSSRKKTNIQKLAKYLCESPDLHSPKIKERLLTYIAFSRSQTVPSSLFLIDPNVAKTIFNALKPYFKRYSGHILEANAGPGVLSNLLMKAKFKRLRIYESNVGFLSDLCLLKKTLKSDAQILEYNLLRMKWMMNRDLEDQIGRLKTVFDGIEPTPWEAPDPVLRVFMILPHETFLVSQMYDLMKQGGFFAYGRPEFFLIMPAINFKNLSVKGRAKLVYKSVLFNLLFESFILEENIPETAVLPWRYKRKLDMKELKGEEDHLILVKVTPKQSLHPYVKSNQLTLLLFFVRVLVFKQNQTILSALEKWAPGIGLRLIPMGYDIYTKCKSLTSEQVLELYEIFITNPEFSKESFHSMMEFDQMNSETLQEILLDDCKVKKPDADQQQSNSNESLQPVEEETITHDSSLSEESSDDPGKS